MNAILCSGRSGDRISNPDNVSTGLGRALGINIHVRGKDYYSESAVEGCHGSDATSGDPINLHSCAVTPLVSRYNLR